MAFTIKDALVQHGKVIRGWLGVAVQDLTEDLSRALAVEPRSGVLVAAVTPRSPAARAGLQRGDVITAINGATITEASQLRNLIALTASNTRVQVELRRAGRARTIEVTLGEQPPDVASPSRS